MAMDPRAAMKAAISIPGVPRDVDGPVFREPWDCLLYTSDAADE